MIAKTLALACAVSLLALGAHAQPAAATAANDYAKPETWLCWPGKAGNACAVDITATVIQANGAMAREAFKPDPKALIDCFYVYPTVSNDKGVVSDMIAGPEETGVVRAQLARLGSKCRIYAPLYRQFTLTALRAASAGTPLPGSADPAVRLVGYTDVVDAWNYYLAHANNGRGVVLVGHSQGSGVLTRLIAAEIDGKPVQKQLISAILMGTSLGVDKGKDTGTFKSIPTCKSPTQTGCVIAYATFRDTAPPPANSRFGRVQNPDMEAVCTNPAALGVGKGEFKAYLSNTAAEIANSAAVGPTWVKGKASPTTPYVTVPGLLSGECVSKNGFNYLAAHVNANPADPRTDTIVGDVVGPGGQVATDWGLHLIDANIAMGNLVDVVAAQGKAWRARK